MWAWLFGAVVMAIPLGSSTVPVGDTRERYAPRLEAASSLRATGGATERINVAFSPERLYSGAALANLATYPKLVGGLDDPSTALAAAFYEGVLDAEVVAMSSAEAAEFSKLADTTYRDVNIALANEFARYADRIGVDITEVIDAANSQPYSHIHQPGIGVGGHCIPVYPHFLLDRAPELSIVARAREVNDGQVGLAVAELERALGDLSGHYVLVLGLTYRQGVKELAYSRAIPLIADLRERGARVLAHDPLLTDDEVDRLDATPWTWATPATGVAAIVTQTADPAWASLEPGWFPDLRVVYDGRNSLAGVMARFGPEVAYRGVGVPERRDAADPVASRG